MPETEKTEKKRGVGRLIRIFTHTNSLNFGNGLKTTGKKCSKILYGMEQF